VRRVILFYTGIWIGPNLKQIPSDRDPVAVAEPEFKGETEGPDEVGEHCHPILDQLFLGLSSCNCIFYADDEQTILSENMLLHIPLGSKHAVSVSKGNTLAYIWMDFFLTLEGEKYMREQHQMEQ